MNRAFVLLVVVLTGAAAGCAQVGEDVGLLRGPAPHTPYYVEHRDALVAQYNRSWPFPVDPGATSVVVNVTTEFRTGGLLADGPTPAAVTVTLVDPAGATLAESKLDPANPAATLRATPRAPGDYAVRVAGSAPSADAPTTQVRTTYLLSVEVGY